MGRTNWIYTYYQQITDGSVTVGQWIRLIYDYIIHGLEEKRFRFDQKKANKAIDWIEKHCFHVEGPLAPGPLKLETWQKAAVSCIFGIVDNETGLRSFREILLLTGRVKYHSLLPPRIFELCALWRPMGGPL